MQLDIFFSFMIELKLRYCMELFKKSILEEMMTTHVLKTWCVISLSLGYDIHEVHRGKRLYSLCPCFKDPMISGGRWWRTQPWGPRWVWLGTSGSGAGEAQRERMNSTRSLCGWVYLTGKDDLGVRWSSYRKLPGTNGIGLVSGTWAVRLPFLLPFSFLPSLHLSSPTFSP